MKKDAFTSPTQRSIAYFMTFAVGAALFEAIRPLIARRCVIPVAIAYIGIFAIIGAFLIHNRNVSSRITSGVTLLILGVISIHIGSSIPVAYELLFVLTIAWLGSLPIFHRRQKTALRTIVLNVSTILVAVTIIVIYAFVSIWLMRLALANVHYCL